MATIAEIAAVSPTAVAIAKRAMVQMDGLDTHDALAKEADAFMSAFHTEDSVEGRAAFVEKRTAEFPGK